MPEVSTARSGPIVGNLDQISIIQGGGPGPIVGNMDQVRTISGGRPHIMIG